MKWLWITLVGVAAMAGLIAAIGAMLPVNHTASRRARFRQPSAAVWSAISRGGQKTFREDDVNYEVVEAVPERRLVTRITDKSLPYGGSWIYEITPDEGGSILHITERGEVYNPIFRFVSRYIMGHTATIDASLQTLAKKFGDKIAIEDDQPAAR